MERFDPHFAEVTAKPHHLSLPYSAFDNNQQHVTYAAIAENKRLGDVLVYANALQDAAPPKANTVGKQKTR